MKLVNCEILESDIEFQEIVYLDSPYQSGYTKKEIDATVMLYN